MPQKTPRKSESFKKPNLLKNNFLLALLCLMVISASAVGGLTKYDNPTKLPSQKLLSSTNHQEPTIENKNLPPPVLSAKSVFAEDLKTGKVLLAKNEKDPALPASTTKIATALVALSHYQLSDVLLVGNIRNIDGQKMKLFEGEQITVENLLYGLLVFSANDAAEVLAQNYPGGKANFTAAMNQLAKDQRLEDTNFTNPQGFDDYLHFSSAKDLVKLTHFAIQNPTFAKIVGTKTYLVTNVNGTIIHKVSTTNVLLEQMPGILGVKTGWTENSGEDLVTLYEKDSHKILVSVLGSSNRFGETKKVLDWIFENYEWK